MAYRTAIMATIALTLSTAALAAMVYTDTYAQAAQAEASGYHALTEQWQANGDVVACADDVALTVRQ
jgi:hypothetical protein